MYPTLPPSRNCQLFLQDKLMPAKALALPDEVIKLINLRLVVVRQRVLFSLLAFDEGCFNLRRVGLTQKCSLRR